MSENIQDIYPLSPMQQGMLFHSLYAPETEVYSEQLSCKLIGKLDIEAFQRAWQEVVNRHDILRTAFVWEDLDEPLQVVHKTIELPFEILDWSDKTVEQQKSELSKLLPEKRKIGWELTDAPLMRITIIRLSENSNYFVWNNHHLLLDGWALPIILGEVFTFYDSFSQGKEAHLSSPRPYSEYIAWLQEQDIEKAKQFWKSKLEGITAPTPLVIDLPNVKPGGGYKKERFLLSQELSDHLNDLVRDHKLTLNTIIQGAWAFLLHIYSGENDILFGSTVSGRPTEIPGVETMVGLFINTLPVRVKVDPGSSILHWLTQLQMEQAEFRQYEYSPLVEIHGMSEVPRDSDLFKSILVFENYPVDESLQERQSTLSITEVSTFERTNYPITLVASPGKVLGIDLAYESNRFNQKSILRMLNHLESIIRQFAERPKSKLAELTIISEEEKVKVIHQWNKTEADFPKEITLNQWFEKTVSENPNGIALQFEKNQLTFEQLNNQSNQLAHYLRSKGVTHETLVGISLDRSFDMIISLIAVLKAGGAYVPMDTEYPDDRLEYMITDSNIDFLITHSSYSNKFEKYNLHIIEIDTEQINIEKERKTNPNNVSTPFSLAYIIYTSGSTGNPKGVLLQHQGLCNFISIMCKDYNVSSTDNVIQFSSFSFDASVAEIFLGILSGATLHFATRDILLSSDQLIDFLNNNNITVATLPPSLLTLISPDQIKSLKSLASVGDSCSWDLAQKWSKKRKFFNGYGPTETTIGAAWHLVKKPIEGTITAPIGKPVNNIKIYILDSNLQPVPLGIPGEIYIGGISLARGYLNRPDLTADKFLPDPHTAIEGARLYKTGDLGRFLEDGNIEFIGRVDFQVKLRGFRIEIGEIEATLKNLSSVQDAVVLVKENIEGDKRLIAYIVNSDSNTVSASEIREVLKEQLPEFMIPAGIVVMESFPLTPSGKVNRRALPEPDEDNLELTDIFVAPRSAEEEILTGIFSDILRIQKVGINSSFFDLGGHSLMATQVISRIRDTFDIEIPLRILFEAPTIALLVQQIEIFRQKDEGIPVPPFEVISREEELPLSFAQQRLWFLDQLEPGSASYNIPVAMKINGNLNIAAFEESIGEVISRHETLRTTFSSTGGKPVQIISEKSDFRLRIIDLRPLSVNDRENEAKKLAIKDAQEPFDLVTGPLFRASLILLTDNECMILMNMHHIISDGWSGGIIINEVANFYKSIINDETSPLTDLEYQYVDFAAWQRSWLQGEALENQITFWKNQLAGSPPLLELPTDRPRPAVQTFNGSDVKRHFSKEISDALVELSQKEGVTHFMVLIAAFQVLLHRYSNQDEILVGSPIANRTRSEIEHLIGFFVNTLVFKANLEENLSFIELLRQVRETALGAYAHQDLPFEKLVEELHPSRDLSHSPIFQVAFVYQNAPTSNVVELPDLTLNPVETESTTAKYDLTLTVAQSPEGLFGSLEYNTDLFDVSTIERMLNHYKMLLEKIIKNPDDPIEEYLILDDAEKQRLLYEWNQTETEYPSGKCVHQWFEEYANNQPDALAVSFKADTQSENTQLTYQELNQKANQLASYLRKLEVGPEKIVGICMERSVEMVIAMLGILKAGGAYVPIDPAYPTDRIEYMIKDSGLYILLTQDLLISNLPNHNGNNLCLDTEWDKISKHPSENLPIKTDPDNIAYLIYTSGSTGKPKGTMLRHRGACNLAVAQMEAFGVKNGSRIMQFSSLSFDAATWEFIMAMLSGSALVLSSSASVANGQELVKIMSDQKVTTITIPPSVLAVLPTDPLPDLKTVVTAGEAVSGELVERWGESRQFVNAYGPTETTVCASMHECVENYPKGPPIGKPIGNFQLYILDKNFQPVPVGVPGELCMAGVGLARGYLNRPDLTADQFMPNPFSEVSGERLYRSGDLVRYLEDGNIEFLGRIDQQVKVRGFRIELGEIEAILDKHESITDLTVLAREDKPGDKRLVAYIVTNNKNELNAAGLKSYMRSELPEYMVPTAIVFLDELPLTPNGKLDRNALPIPEISRDDLASQYVAPSNDGEEKLVQIVSELLQVEKVGINDNFFELGGHSLLATQFISRIREAFDVELPLKVLFEKPTAAEIVQEINRASQEEKVLSTTPSIERVSRTARKVRRPKN